MPPVRCLTTICSTLVLSTLTPYQHASSTLNQQHAYHARSNRVQPLLMAVLLFDAFMLLSPRRVRAVDNHGGRGVAHRVHHAGSASPGVHHAGHRILMSRLYHTLAPIPVYDARRCESCIILGWTKTTQNQTTQTKASSTTLPRKNLLQERTRGSKSSWGSSFGGCKIPKSSLGTTSPPVTLPSLRGPPYAGLFRRGERRCLNRGCNIAFCSSSHDSVDLPFSLSYLFVLW